MVDKVGAFPGKSTQVMQAGDRHDRHAGFLCDGLSGGAAGAAGSRLAEHFLAVQRDHDAGRSAAAGADQSLSLIHI